MNYFKTNTLRDDRHFMNRSHNPGDPYAHQVTSGGNAYEDIDGFIWQPQAIAATVAIFHVDSLKYPNGITIANCQITLAAAATYSMVFQEWGGASITYQSIIATVSCTLAGKYGEAVGATIHNASIDADDYIFIKIPNTTVNSVHVKVLFTID